MCSEILRESGCDRPQLYAAGLGLTALLSAVFLNRVSDIRRINLWTRKFIGLISMRD
jgi:hypothetical protein